MKTTNITIFKKVINKEEKADTLGMLKDPENKKYYITGASFLIEFDYFYLLDTSEGRKVANFLATKKANAKPELKKVRSLLGIEKVEPVEVTPFTFDGAAVVVGENTHGAVLFPVEHLKIFSASGGDFMKSTSQYNRPIYIECPKVYKDFRAIFAPIRTNRSLTEWNAIKGALLSEKAFNNKEGLPDD